MKKRIFYFVLLVAIYGMSTLVADSDGKIRIYKSEKGAFVIVDKVNKSEAEWKKILTPEQFKILRKKGTEIAFTGVYHDKKDNGVYKCAACGADLFHSDTKFDSRTGWPSYWAPVSEENITTKSDYSLIFKRTEVLCARCGSHLGHVFKDGPKPTGLRYCINSTAMIFKALEKK